MGTELKLRSKAVEWREVEGEVMALDVGAAEYLSLNPTGARLWKALAAGSDRDGLVTTLVDAFRVDEREAADHVDQFVSVLRERDLLEA
jgi:Coenzyme PQQ synthesis protein D (PqqD)